MLLISAATGLLVAILYWFFLPVELGIRKAMYAFAYGLGFTLMFWGLMIFTKRATELISSQADVRDDK